LRFFYASIGAFAAAALTSLIGAALLGTPLRTLPVVLEIAALTVGFIGVMGLVLGCVLLFAGDADSGADRDRRGGPSPRALREPNQVLLTTVLPG
jgi:hypothetical protein